MHRPSSPPEMLEAWLRSASGATPGGRLSIDWAPLEALVAESTPRRRTAELSAAADGQSLLLQQWYQASDPVMEEACGSGSRSGASWGWGCGRCPDHSTISRFRTRLTAAGLAEPLFAEVGRQLAARGLLVKQGTLLDATVVEAQVRRPRGGAADGPKDPDAAWDAGGPTRASGTRCTWGWTPARSWSGGRCSRPPTSTRPRWRML